ncbi:MAG: pyridoxamine 5'-phosphate oxidase family protein [Chloroflexi bacterium]|nr:MAG: pyridoxamine 5'-phosphate oxidase family protein [Chloroflexota bacterium]
MSAREPVTAQLYAPEDTRPETSWAELVRRLAASRTFWLSTARNIRPHVMPLLAVSVDRAIYFCAGPATRKARNLARESRCVLTTAADGVDIVVEGKAVRVTDGPTLERVADEYRSKYGWDPEPRDGEFHGEGAPTAGPPPLHLYELVPETAFGFGTDESLNAMRWTFDRQ